MAKRFLALLLLSSCMLFGATLEEIKASKVIKIGVRLNLPPFSTQDENDNFVGFEISLAKAIGESIVGKGGEVRLIGLNAKDRIPYLQDEIIDIAIANFTKTQERAKKVDFGIPYLSNTQGILTQKSSGIDNISQLRNEKLLVIKGTTSDEFLQKNAREHLITPVECPNVKECFKMLQNNEAKGYMHTSILIAYLPLLDSNIEFGIPNIGGIEFVCPAVSKGNKELLEAVNDIIIDLSKTNFFKNAYNQTFEPFYKGTVNRKFLLLDDLYSLMAN